MNEVLSWLFTIVFMSAAVSTGFALALRTSNRRLRRENRELRTALAQTAVRQLQEEIIANRKRRGWESAHDLSKTTCGLAEEVGEFERARKTKDRDKMIDALADTTAFCLGGFEILSADALIEVTKVVEANKHRSHTGSH